MIHKKFEFGQKVEILAFLERGKGIAGFREWIRVPLVVERVGLYLGYRTLYDGKMAYSEESYPGEGGNYYFKTSKTHRGALVCIAGRKPQYVFEEDIQNVRE